MQPTLSMWSVWFEFFKSLRITTILIASFLIYIFIIKGWRVRKYLNKFPGPPDIPIFGNALQIMDPEKMFNLGLKWYGLYGVRMRGYIGSMNGAFLALDPPDIEKILTSPIIIDKSRLYEILNPWLGDGLLLSTGKKWQKRRKALTPAFHFRVLDNFLPLMNEHAKILVNVLQKREDSEVLEIHSFVTRCALDIICETAMGKKLNSQRHRDNVYAMATIKESEYFWYRATRPWFYIQWLWVLSSTGRGEKANVQLLHDFTDQVIRERKEEFYKELKSGEVVNCATENHEQGGKNEEEDESIYFSRNKKKFAFLDLLLREQANGTDLNLTDQDIRDEVDTFMFEGHDTSAAAMTWAIFLVGLHPEYQAMIHAELDSIFKSDRERDITAGDLAEMKFLECCIKESLRLYPSVPVFGRQLYQDFELDDGAIIPRDATVLVIPYLVHRDPRYFPEPEEFRPSRFFLENSIGRHPYAYIPFSGSLRNCIGQRFAYMEEKVVLATLFRHFKFESVDTRDTVKPLLEVVMRPKNGIRVKIFRR